MMTYVLMGLLVVALAVSVLWGMRYETDKNAFMSVGDTTFLRGLWCLIVVLVHVPPAYQNRLQDMLGSFAYIGVTFFFMTSAYGLKYSAEKKPGYLKHFWKQRLPSILIPAWLANLLSIGIRLLGGRQVSALSFFNVNSWVKVLLVNYAIFWIVYYVARNVIGGGWKEITICAICVAWSLTERLTGWLAMGWEVERLGFVYGVLLAAHYEEVNEWIHRSWKKKTVTLMLLSVLLGVAYLRFKPVKFYGDYLLRILLGVALTAFVMEAVSGFKVGNRINRFLGSVSYEVYLIHETAFATLILVNPELDSGVFIVSAIALAVAAGYALKILSATVRAGAFPKLTE